MRQKRKNKFNHGDKVFVVQSDEPCQSCSLITEYIHSGEIFIDLDDSVNEGEYLVLYEKCHLTTVQVCDIYTSSNAAYKAYKKILSHRFDALLDKAKQEFSM